MCVQFLSQYIPTPETWFFTVTAARLHNLYLCLYSFSWRRSRFIADILWLWCIFFSIVLLQTHCNALDVPNSTLAANWFNSIFCQYEANELTSHLMRADHRWGAVYAFPVFESTVYSLFDEPHVTAQRQTSGESPFHRESRRVILFKTILSYVSIFGIKSVYRSK